MIFNYFNYFNLQIYIMNTLFSGIVVSKIEDIIIDKCMVLMYDNEITR